jgi:hypothetical protein
VLFYLTTKPTDKTEEQRQSSNYHHSIQSADIEIHSADTLSKDHHQDHQKIVLLVGPHKTSSSSIQWSMCDWLSNPMKTKKNSGASLNTTSGTRTNTGRLRDSWVLPIPDGARRFRNGCAKAFAPFANALNDLDSRSGLGADNEIIEMYRDEIHKQWNLGYNLVIAAEAFDHIASTRNGGNQILENLLHILPLASTTDEMHSPVSNLTAVVVYRTPRKDHLVSIWHSIRTKNPQSFYDFLMQTMLETNMVFILDSLMLAERFVKHGINTVLIDLSGVKKYDFDISHVVACDVLGANCTAEKHFVGNMEFKPVIRNVKHHSDQEMNVTDAQLAAIDKLIESYDCNFQHILDNEKLKILYPYELDRIMNLCSKYSQSDYPKSHDQIMKKIVEIIMSEEE